MDSVNTLKDTAAKWIARRASEDWSAQDEAELARWLDSSTANLVAFLRLEAAWNDAGRLKVLGAGMEPGVVPGLEDFRGSPFFRPLQAAPAPAAPAKAAAAQRSPRIYAITAAASLLIVVAGVLLAWSAYRPTSYSTPIGVTAAVPLADGSKVTLNTDSRIHVDVAGPGRSVTLDHGEAYFEVVKDPARPFTVQAADKRIVVLGTKFAVRRDGDDVQVIVTEGSVSVGQDKGGSAVPPARLTAGNIARAKDGNVAIRTRTVSETEELLSWRSGYVVFHETPLGQAAAEFNRYNKRKIVVADPAVNEVTISGNFRSTNVESFARLLEDGFPVSVQRHGDSIVLTKRKER